MIGLQHYLTLSAILFAMSIAGIFINRRNLILLLMCIELMLLAVNFNFIAFSRHLGDETGQVFVFFILTVAAAEAAIGLAILVVLFRNPGLACLGNNAARQFCLVFQHGIDLLFDGPLRNEFMNHDIFVLTDAEGAVRGLIFHGGVPPPIKVNHVIGGREI